MWHNLKLSHKLLAAFLLVGLTSILVTSWQSYVRAKAALEHASFERLTVTRQIKKRQIEAYFALMRQQVTGMAAESVFVEATKEFKAAFAALETAPPPDAATDQKQRSRLVRYYENELLHRVRMQGPAVDLTADRLLPTTAPSQYLQYHYIAANPHPTGEKNCLDDAGDGSLYSSTHARYHSNLSRFCQLYGFYDAFLIDAASGKILFSVAKEVDFATDLLTGPYAQSSLAQVFKKARSASQGTAVLADFAAYIPSYMVPEAFIAAPIFAGDTPLGVLALQIPIDRINQIMTGAYGWAAEGLGQTGETYIVGADYLMRNDSRFIIEAPDRFFAELEAQNADPGTLGAMRYHATSIKLQQVRTEASEAALSGQVDTRMITDYRGIPVLSAFSPLDIPGLHWAILAEIDRDEIFAPVRTLARANVLLAAVLSLIIIGLGAVVTSSIARPIKALADDVEGFGQGDLDKRTAVTSRDETGRLGQTFNTMAGTIQDNIAQLHRLQGELEQANEVLEQKVIERTAQLAAAHRLLELRVRELDGCDRLERLQVTSQSAAVGHEVILQVVQEVLGVEQVILYRIEDNRTEDMAALVPLGAIGLVEPGVLQRTEDLASAPRLPLDSDHIAARSVAQIKPLNDASGAAIPLVLDEKPSGALWVAELAVDGIDTAVLLDVLWRLGKTAARVLHQIEMNASIATGAIDVSDLLGLDD